MFKTLLNSNLGRRVDIGYGFNYHYDVQNSDDQHTLVAGLKQQNPDAFKTLIKTYKNPVANICYRFLFNMEDAEELAQEVFLAIYQGIHNFRGEAKLSTWIYQLSASKSIDLIRKRKRKKRMAHVVSLKDLREDGGQIRDQNNKNPGEYMENEEKGKIIQDAIDSLPVKYRRVFTLSKCEGFGNKEVAEVMGMTQSAVESLVHRAKKKLRKILYGAFEQELKKNSKHLQNNNKSDVSKRGNIFLIILISILMLYPAVCGLLVLLV